MGGGDEGEGLGIRGWRWLGLGIYKVGGVGSGSWIFYVLIIMLKLQQ